LSRVAVDNVFNFVDIMRMRYNNRRYHNRWYNSRIYQHRK